MGNALTRQQMQQGVEYSCTPLYCIARWRILRTALKMGHTASQTFNPTRRTWVEIGRLPAAFMHNR